MDLPMTGVEFVPEKEKIENGKEGCPAFHCDLYDTEIVHKIAQVFLPGLSAACVDNTTGGIFRSPASVAVDLRKEMIDYLTQLSESFVAESVILEGGPDTEVSDHPYDIISDFVDDFTSSKRNFFSRVSGWLLSEKREDKIDDFVQEMEINGFWLTDRRELIAQTLLKNIDFKNTFHCDKKFNTAEELAEHVINCDFSSMNCMNDGCTVVFCASHIENHDSVCPFKIIPCEQKCADNIMRREMDRHCITVCPMKLVNCPFYAVGCQSTVPRCMIQQHCSDDFNSHLVYALKNIHQGASEEDLKQRADQIMQSSSGQLEASRDARSLALSVRVLDAKLGPLEIKSGKKISEESAEAANNISDKSTEAVNKATEESSEAGVVAKKVSEESAEAAKDIIDKSTDVMDKAIEESSVTGNGVKNISEASAEAANDINDKSTKALSIAMEESSQACVGAKRVGEESADAAKDISGKSTDVTNKAIAEPSETRNGINNISEASAEAANDISDKSTKAINKATEESSEAGVVAKKVSEESAEAAKDSIDKSTDVMNRATEESSETVNGFNKVTEACVGTANDISNNSTEATHKAIQISSEDRHDSTEKSTNATNKVDEEFIEISNLTTHASEEANSQVST